MRLVPLFVGAALALGGVSVAQTAAASPTSAPVSGISAPGESIAAAPDGSMWLAEPAGPGRVARVASNGTVTEYTGGVTPSLAAGGSPSKITVTPDGYAWFLTPAAGTEIGSIAPNTGAVATYSLTFGTPTSLAAGPDGNLWLTATGFVPYLTDFVAKYTRTSNSIQQYATALSAPRALTVGSDGSLYFAENGLLGDLGRITTDGTVSHQTIGGTPTSMAVGPSGALWFARAAGLGILGAGSSTTLFATATTPTAVAAGPDGAMWSATTGGVVRVAPGGPATTISAGVDPAAVGTGLAAGPDGRMWMTLDRAPYLVRITVPPRVGAAAGTSPTATTATVTADVRPNGLPTTAELQVRDAGGAWNTLTQSAVGNGTDSTPVRFDIDQLAATTSYALRIVATNDAGSSISSEADVVTGSLPAPTPTPTIDPTPAPTIAPTPTIDPTPVPTINPTPTPTIDPTPTPTIDPTPTPVPTIDPTPTPIPTIDPTPVPTIVPVPIPTIVPVPIPTIVPVPIPTITPAPVATIVPTPGPTFDPGPLPTLKPAPTPSLRPTLTLRPAQTPTSTPIPATAAVAAPIGNVLEATPAPVQGDTIVLRPMRGTVRYRVPGATTAQNVQGPASIPTGSIIDTTGGAVTLSSSVNGVEQQGFFSGGEFKVKQVSATGMTQLYLTAKLDCANTGTRAVKFGATTKRRHVWGQDNHGRFQTHGQDSVATVRGTRWLTTDTCAGTVVKVFEGVVSVQPKVKGSKAVIVKAGGRSFTPHR